MDPKIGLWAAIAAGVLVCGVGAYWYAGDDLPKPTMVQAVPEAERIKLFNERHPAPTATPTPKPEPAPQSGPAPGPAEPVATPAPPSSRRRGGISAPVRPQATAPQGGWSLPAGTVITPELARTALSFVGADRDAEKVWVQAINDPSRSPHERQDLIEDLNETGFDDPGNLTMDDLPLIQARIAIIETIGGQAMDQTNSDAFQEAYKDLLNMRARLTGQQ